MPADRAASFLSSEIVSFFLVGDHIGGPIPLGHVDPHILAAFGEVADVPHARLDDEVGVRGTC